ncbi:MAG TPA: 16S rRNA (adenine(1518)-N(6)/adenine(1519)-N(6))-dimethyltransferase RsmA [Thermodesulfobacteriota bacterium]|nr:16S rRNA (adenine(1518)-N(6)/adenine(1519)-N(6))-dimethyltransferase RsmA [Thermodesulfobacteriota bacterium]
MALEKKERYGLRPKKRFGQHFLRDRNILKKIVRVAQVRPGEHVLEIGPGPGTLTEALIEAGATVTAVELDREICDFLRKKFAGVEEFDLVEGDAAGISYIDLSREKKTRFKVVSNPPYNITGPLLVKFFNEREAFTGVTIMLQKEVAQRVASGPGTRDYGILSVLLQLHYDVKIEFNVSKNLFTPTPKVDSSVLGLRPLPGPRVPVESEAFFTRVVRTAFGTRRKTLLNALKPLGAEKQDLVRAFEKAGIDPKRRAETLSLEEFSALASALLEGNFL